MWCAHTADQKWMEHIEKRKITVDWTVFFSSFLWKQSGEKKDGKCGTK